MQKSTPLSHLPTMQLPVMNDPQRQQSPQSQQPIIDVQEDANAVHEALNALGAPPPSQSSQLSQSQPSHQPMHEEPIEERFIYDPDIERILEQREMQAGTTSDVDMKTKIMQDILSWNNDLKIALFAAGIFVILHSLPIEKYIYKYISLDKLPNSDLLIKTVLMFVCVLLVSKLI